MGEQASDGGAAGMIRTQHLSQKDPQCDQRRKDPIQPAAQRGQRLNNHFFCEDVSKWQVFVLKKLAGLLAHPILASEADFAYVVYSCRIAEIYVPFVDVAGADWRNGDSCRGVADDARNVVSTLGELSDHFEHEARSISCGDLLPSQLVRASLVVNGVRNPSDDHRQYRAANVHSLEESKPLHFDGEGVAVVSG
jgi:hypothetical protein